MESEFYKMEARRKYNRIMQETIFDRVKDIQEAESRVHHVFQNNVGQWIFKFLVDNSLFEPQPLMHLFRECYDMQHSGKPLIAPSESNTIPYFSLFIEEELGDINAFKEMLGKNYIDSNLFLYEEFLSKNQIQYNKIDRLINFINKRNSFGSFYKYAKNKINGNDLDIFDLNNKVEELFDNADRIVLESWLDLNPLDPYYLEEENLSFCFDFNYYRNPLTLSEFPSQKTKYLKTLKSWLLKCIDERKRVLLLNETQFPPVYSCIMNYANSLQDNRKESGTVQNKQGLEPVTVTEVTAKEYPRYIFKDFHAYSFFDLLTKKMNSHAQLSFVFRMMSEKENPKLIICKETIFREWFNTKYPDNAISSYLRTYENAKNQDRIAFYMTLKELKYSE